MRGTKVTTQRPTPPIMPPVPGTSSTSQEPKVPLGLSLSPDALNDNEHLRRMVLAILSSLERRRYPVSPLCDALLHASESLDAAHERILDLVRHIDPPYPHLVSIAKLCLHGPVGRVGDRTALRALANMILDTVLKYDYNNTAAMCLKGESLLPPIFFGQSYPYMSRSILREAYLLFSRAHNKGDPLGSYLMGRWLLSMESLHKDPEHRQAGANLVKGAADKNCGRALTFLAHRYEFPALDVTSSFINDVPKHKPDRDKYIIGVYLTAAQHGDADAFNDIGTAYAQGYGGLEQNFDNAVRYYETAIEKGSVLAFDNLGTHYETGMGGHCPDRVDNRKALYYYRQGTKKRCPKCAYNLGAAHEEGMSGVLPRNTRRAEKYYRYAIRLSDDWNDAPTAAKCVKDLQTLYMTRIKLDAPDGDVANEAAQKLVGLLQDQGVVDRLMGKVNQAIRAALRNRGKCPQLKKMLGDTNAKMIVDHCRNLDREVRARGDPATRAALEHVLGVAEQNDGDVMDDRLPELMTVPVPEVAQVPAPAPLNLSLSIAAQQYEKETRTAPGGSGGKKRKRR